jgi:hypothetical protein
VLGLPSGPEIGGAGEPGQQIQQPEHTFWVPLAARARQSRDSRGRGATNIRRQTARQTIHQTRMGDSAHAAVPTTGPG